LAALSEVSEDKQPTFSPGRFWWIPLLVFVSIALGFWIALGLRDTFFKKDKKSSTEIATENFHDYDIWSVVKDYILEYYVDTISSSRLENGALSALLNQLDPHSEYIPPSQLQTVTETLEGNFEGIGVEFNIIRDTVFVVTVIPGGPSEQAGLFAGDRIIRADTTVLSGRGVTNEKVIRTLRGPKNTKVKVWIMRRGFQQLMEFTITRGKIPIHSLEAAFMIRPGIGYVKFRQFSATTTNEFREAINKLYAQGMKKIILDLRDNGGGYLNAAVEMADEFLMKGVKVVYTEGRKYPKKEYFATEYGSLERIPVVVLVNEGSASASEIVAGAIQDNDRGVIAGRRTFGKGLVQDQIPLMNGGAIRLTVARYYTPSGRCIQKTYSHDHLNYFMEEIRRYDEGELFHSDSIRPDTSSKFKTSNGRIVYGGGGIIPDVFVPLDTTRFHSVVNRWYRSGKLTRFCFDWADKNRTSLKKEFSDEQEYVRRFVAPETLLNEWAETLTEKEKNYMSREEIRQQLKFLFKTLIARNILGDNVFYSLWLQKDNDVQKAMEIIMNEKIMEKILKNNRF